MKTVAGFLMSALIPAFMLASPALAQDKAKDAKAAPPAKDAKAAPPAKAEKGKNTIKVLVDNDKVRVQEVTFKPGDEGPNVDRPNRVIRALKGGTLQRTWADGKVDKFDWKTDETRYVEATKAYVPKNTGKSDVVLYVVLLKDPAKKDTKTDAKKK